jgi:chromosome segregation ATPase
MTEESREVREARAPVWEAEVPWVVSYLREDIQDLRNEVREVRRSVQRLDEKLDSGLERLDAKIDARTDGLDAKIEGLRQEMGVQLRWIIGIVIGAILTMTGVFAWIVDRMLTP